MKSENKFMMICLIFISIMIGLLCIESSYAVIIESDIEAWYDFKTGSGTTLIDETGNYDGTFQGTPTWDGTNVPSNLTGSIDFDGSSDWIESGDIDLTSAISMCSWVYNDVSTAGSTILSKRDNSFYSWEMSMSTNLNNAGMKINNNANIDKEATSDNVLYFVCGTYGGGTINFYINAVNNGGGSSYAAAISTNDVNVAIGRRSFIGAEAYFNGRMSQAIIFNRVITQTEITDLYNGGAGKTWWFSPPPSIPEIIIDDISLINNSFHNSSIPIQLNLSISNTNEDINSSYSLNESSFIKFGTNTLQPNGTIEIDTLIVTPIKNTFELGAETFANITPDKGAEQYCQENYNQSFISYGIINSSPIAQTRSYFNGSIWSSSLSVAEISNLKCKILGDGNYPIIFQVENNETQTNSSTLNFILDTQEPTINIIDNSTEFNTYDINFSTIFNVTDSLSGIASCTINITDFENVTNPDNFLINCTDSQTFIHAGVHNFLVKAFDNAGNINTLSINRSINPLINLNWRDEVRNLNLSSYSVSIFHPDGRITTQTDINGTIFLSPVNNGVLDLGLHTIQLTKAGYKIENFTQIVNATNAGINVTFNATPANLFIQVLDEKTLLSITSFNAIIDNGIGDKISFSGVQNITLFTDSNTTPLGNISIELVAAGYQSRTYQITLDEFSIVSLTGYLLDEQNGTFIDFFIFNQDNAIVEDATIVIFQKLNDSNIIIEQVKTDAAGYGSVFIDPTTSNQFFLIIKDGFVQQQFTIRPTTLEYQVFLKPLSDIWKVWDSDISYSLTPKNNILSEPLNLTFTIIDATSSLTIWGFTIRNDTDTIITSTSTSPIGGSLIYLDTQNQSKLIVEYFYQEGTRTQTFTKIYRYTQLDETTLGGFSVLSLLDDFIENIDMSDIAKTLIVIVVMILGIMTFKSIPKTEDKGIHIGVTILGLAGIGGAIHFGLAIITCVGIEIIYFNRQERRFI